MSRGISTNRQIGNIAACLKSNAIAFACRYYSFTTKQPQKRLTQAEAKSLLDKQIKIVTVYEDGPTEPAYFTAARGESDGRRAREFGAALGQPAGSAIYFAVDYDASRADVEGRITTYFEGVARGMKEGFAGTPPYRIGVYGSGRVNKHIKETTGLAAFSWLAESHGWAGHASYPTPDIRQEVSSSPLCDLKAGIGGGYEDNFASGEFGAFSSLASPDTRIVEPQVAEPLAPPGQASEYARRVASLAGQQFQDFHQSSEDQSPLKEQIRVYWEDLGFSFPGVATAWSAVFVSWLMKTAGANSDEFKPSNAHSRFVFRAIANLRNGTGVFRGHPIDDYAPRPGDIIHNNRGGQAITYGFAAAHQAYESHSAVVVELGQDANGRFALTVGGNEGDSVGRKRVELRSDGTIRQRAANPFICVIENRK